jgi:hypothetical protein
MTVMRSRVPYWCFGRRPPTQVLKPRIVRDPDVVVQTRKDANEERQLAAQLTDKDLAAIDEYRRRNPDASSTEIANHLQKRSATAVTYPKDEKFVPYTVPALARKITRVRPLK